MADQGAPEIHPTAVVHPRTEVGAGVRIGPYAVIGERVRLGDGTEVGPHAVLEGTLEVGARCRIFAGAVIGLPPQDLKFHPDTPSGVRIGAETVIREYATIHRASVEDGWTVIGDGCYIMASSHIAHDCRVGNQVVLTGFTGLTGFVEVGDRAVISGLAGIHQFVRIGTLAFVGGCSRLPQDVPPYFLVEGNPAQVRAVNIVGLRRAGVPAADRLEIQRAYKLLYRSGHTPEKGLARIRAELTPSPYIKQLVEFIASSKRGICDGPRTGGPSEAESEPAAARKGR
ncbi:MAG TPA: acyl-ACP--UDP-N-acetylglucosamine O-acyltransferase [Methylomirabilota bacterium]|nr:acyl-ACP--UDP-N-acetylglucosamine O-acyltransferase [Methylomirabilota bacterium]